MELGNMLFGTSRGEYEVPREDAYNAPIESLFEHLGLDYHGCPGFDNGLLEIRPYYWGDCTCGYEERAAEWDTANEHAVGCYQTELHAMEKAVDQEIGFKSADSLSELFAFKETPLVMGGTTVGMVLDGRPRNTNPEHLYELRKAKRDAIMRGLCAKHGIPWDDGAGCAVHCTCDYNARWEAWVAQDGGHAATCPIVLPNLRYRPTGFELKWYKYPLRDSYMNQSLNRKEWQALFARILDEAQRGGWKVGGAGN